MSGAWMSDIKSSASIGLKQGLRTKFYYEEWDPASFTIPVISDRMHANMNRSGNGYAVQRDEMPEAAAVWNERSFKKTHEIFTSGGFFVVRGKLAEILSHFDLGDGGLVPFPIYKADLVTPYGGDFFLLKFGSRKNTIIPEKCEDATKFYVDKDTKQQIWTVNDFVVRGEVVLSSAALDGADLWVEEAVHGKIFMSDPLAAALQEADLAEDWALQPCRIVEAGQ